MDQNSQVDSALSSSQQAEFIDIIMALPDVLQDGDCEDLLHWILNATGLDRAFYAEVTGRFYPWVPVQSLVNLPPDFLRDRYEVLYKEGEYTDPLFHTHFTEGFGWVYHMLDLSPNQRASVYTSNYNIQNIEFHDFITAGIYARPQKCFISLFATHDQLLDEQMLVFADCIKLLWKTRFPNTFQYFQIDPMTDSELYPFQTSNIQEELENISRATQANLNHCQNYEQTNYILNKHIENCQILIRNYTETPIDRWKRDVPALMNWGNKPKDDFLERRIDPVSGRRGYEKPSDYLNRILREAGLGHRPQLSELRQINPAFVAALDREAQKIGKSASFFVPPTAKKI